jgi:hypothetical protein
MMRRGEQVVLFGGGIFRGGHLGLGRDQLGAEVSRQCPAGPFLARHGL